jgi:hypothetical protein
VALDESFLINNGGCDEDVSFGTAGDVALFCVAEGDILGRFARGELGRDGGAWFEGPVGGGVDGLIMPLRLGVATAC